ncbi:DoxX family protein [Methylomonas sp. MgM2]
MNVHNIYGFSGPDKRAKAYFFKLEHFLDTLAPLGDLALRCWVAYAFWVSGLTKIRTWDSTLYLFEYEYKVLLLPPDLAAVLGTGVELLGPVFLALGFFGRAAAAVLFLFNIVALISYPDLGPAGIEQHQVWGLMLLVCLLHGPGRYSADAWIKRRFFNYGG